VADPSVAHVVSVMGGGIGRLLESVLPEQARLRCAVTLYVRECDDDLRARLGKAGVRVETIGSLVALAVALRRSDVVHFHTLNLDLFLAGVVSGRPLVYTMHGLRATTRSPGTVSVRRLPTARGLWRRVKRELFVVFLRSRVRAVAAPSAYLAGVLSDLYRIPPRKLFVVPNGIPLTDFLAHGPREESSDLVVGFVGRLVAVKRVDLLLRAFSGIVGEWHGRELKLLIVGDGELRDELRTLADQLGIAEQVTFVGQVSEPETYLHDMDVFVLPSRNEGAPLAVMESLAAGVPVVAMRDGGGAAELVERSGGGVIAEDDRGLTSAVSDLLADAGGRAALAERARTYAAQELDVRVCARRYVELYAGLPASSCHGTVAP